MVGATMFGVYEIATGRLRSIGSSVGVLPDGLASAPLPEGGTANVTHVWDEDTRAWVPYVETITRMSAGDFMRRVGFEREVVLRAVMRDPATPITVAAQLDTLSEWLKRIVASGVDLDDPIVPMGVELMGGVLASVNQLPEGLDAFRASMLRRVP